MRPDPAKVQIIRSWDCSMVNRRLRSKGMSDVDICALEGAYKDYLVLCLTDPKGFVLSEPVDGYVHEHMLFTLDFGHMMKRLGCSFEHWPTTTVAEAKALLPDYQERTLGGLASLFGSVSSILWPGTQSICTGRLVPLSAPLALQA